jgi:hypothetical protein
MLLDSRTVTLVENEFVEDRQNLFPVAIKAPQRVAKMPFKPFCFQPLLKHRLGNIDVAAEGLGRMTAQEKSVEHSGLALRGKRVELVLGDHHNYSALKKASINSRETAIKFFRLKVR